MLKIAKLSTKQVKLKSKFKKFTDQPFLDYRCSIKNYRCSIKKVFVFFSEFSEIFKNTYFE